MEDIYMLLKNVDKDKSCLESLETYKEKLPKYMINA